MIFISFMVINLDQTSKKFKPGSKSTLTNAGFNSVRGGNGRRMITVTFSNTYR